jgi:hypothetical protein
MSRSRLKEAIETQNKHIEQHNATMQVSIKRRQANQANQAIVTLITRIAK